ncbi:hypothetical protein HGM15179_015766 [Zosterops borbonicus]|uniref:Integrase zinc-binding domain-containing protein n=1 Tax=Zosterops borbonicus TaxID=364589 RepID=A0A8K1G464_9PASS|nr:hypothetical protein HGM15179_015766 [Zosterops borbonicus]
MALIPAKVGPVQPYLGQKTSYSAEDEKLAQLVQAQKNAMGWYVTGTGQVVVPTKLMKVILETEHNKCHWGAEVLVKFLKREIISNQMLTMAKRVNAMCPVCLKNNPIVRKQIQLEKLQVLVALKGALQWNRPLPLENPVHDIQPGDQMMKHWDGLTREVLHAPPLSEFKARLDGALTNQIQ